MFGADSFGWIVLAGAPALVVVLSVLYNSTTIAALAQQGSVQQRDHVQKRFNPVKSKLQSAQKGISVKQRLTYSLGVFNVGLTTYILGGFPTRFWLLFAPKSLGLILWRFISFRKRGLHYYLFDFCYWVNGLALIYIFFFPHNITLFRALFFTANGPLAWSILAFNNALIFHSVDHITSVNIHISPMALTFGLRWYASDEFTVCEEGAPGCESMDLTSALLPAVCLYVVWMACYYIWVFVLRAKRVENRGYETLYNYLMSKGLMKWVVVLLGGKAVSIGRKVRNKVKSAASYSSTPSSNRNDRNELKKEKKELKSEDSEKGDNDSKPVESRWQSFVNKAIYLLLHYTFGFATMLLALIMWHNFYAHIAFGLAIFFASGWNASLFYFKYIEFYNEEHKSSRE